MGGASRWRKCCGGVWGFLCLIGFTSSSAELGTGDSFIPPNSAVVLLAGLAGDVESEHQYLDQLQTWLKTLAGVADPPEKVFVLWESPETVRGQSNLPVQVLKAGRDEFLTLGKSLAGRTNPVVVVAWGHGGMQGKTPVFHVRGPRITPEDFKTFAAHMPAAASRWVLMFRSSGRFASALAAEKRQIIASEKETMFASDPVGMALLLKAFQNNGAISFPSLADELGRMTAAWYSDRSLARTEEPTFWNSNQPPRLLVSSATSETLASVAPSRQAEEPLPPKTESAPGKDADLPPVWKEISRAEPQWYPDADGVVLRRRIRHTLGSSPVIATEQEQFVQILTAEGKRFGDFDISYWPPQEDITFQDCEVLCPDGTILRLDPDDIRETAEESVGDYRKPRRKFFSLPGVVPGAVLHVRYQTEWKKFPMPHVSLKIPLDSELPTLDSTIQIRMPKESAFHFAFEQMTAPDPVVSQTTYGNSYTWQFSDLPSQEHEPLAPPHLQPALLISTFPDWSAFADWYGRIIKLTDVVTPEIAAKAAELAREAKTDRDRALAIYNYVTRLRYVAIPLGVNSFRPHAAAHVLQNHFGDCKDKANLFNTLLRALNIDAQLVLVPRFAQAHDAIPGLAFNHAISRVSLGNEILWVDTTDDVCRFGMLPPGDPGRKVLVIDGKSNSLTPLPSPGPQEHQLNLRAQVTYSGDAEALPANFHVITKGFPDHELRTAAREAKQMKSLPLLSARFRPVAGAFGLEKQRFTPVSALDEDFEWKAEGKWAGILSVTGDKCSVHSPFWLPREWDLAFHARKAPLFLNQGYPLTLDEEFEFAFGEKAPQNISLPAVSENDEGPLRWKLEWSQRNKHLLNAKLYLVLAGGELSASDADALQKQLRRLLAALAQGASFTIRP